MEQRISQVYCAIGDGDANEFLQRHPDWELHSTVGISSGEDGVLGAPGYVFVKRESLESGVW